MERTDYSDVLICTPVRDGRFHTGYVVGMMHGNGLHGGWLPYSGQSDIYLARNILMNGFYKTLRYNTVVFIDSDIGFTRNDLKRLIDSEGDVVSGIYTDKSQPPVPFCRDGTGEIVALNNIPPEGMIPSLFIPGGFFKVERHVLDKLVASGTLATYGTDSEVGNHYLFYETTIYNNIVLSEDYAFSAALMQIELMPWTNCGIRVNHDGRTWDGKPSEQLA